MIRAVVLSACLLVLSTCAPREPSAAHRAECERRGWTEGTPAFRRCIRGLEGQEVIDMSRPGRDQFVR